MGGDEPQAACGRGVLRQLPPRGGNEDQQTGPLVRLMRVQQQPMVMVAIPQSVPKCLRLEQVSIGGLSAAKNSRILWHNINSHRPKNPCMVDS